MTTTDTATLVWGNIKANPAPNKRGGLTTAQARADIQHAFTVATAQHADAVHLTEMVATWRKLADPIAKAHGYRVYRIGYEWLAVRSDLKVLGSARRLLSKGIAYIMPNGYAVSVRVRLAHGTQLVILGTHFVPRWQAYAAKDPGHPKHVALARQQIAKLTTVARIKRKARQLLAIVGDLNAVTVLDFGPGTQALVPPSGLMHAYVVKPAGFNVTTTAKGSSKGHTDHPFRWVRFDIKH